MIVDTRGELSELDVSSAEQQVAFMQSKGVDLDSVNIEACHPLPRRSPNNNPVLILRFLSRKHKTALLKQGKKLKGSNVSHGEAQQRSSKWRFNNHLLDDPNFISFFRLSFRHSFLVITHHNSLLTQKPEQSRRFARQKLYEFGNKPSKYLASLVKG